jgi:UDPglucose 6-dehydrogenase
MKVGIIGSRGVVGTACRIGFSKLGHEVVEHDLTLDSEIQDVVDSDICFICVPTPSMSDGACDTSVVEGCVGELQDLNYEGLVAIKSTIPPGTTQSIINTTTLDICFVPEFLRERCAVADFVEMHDLLAIGTEDTNAFYLIKEVHGSYPKNVVQLTPTEAEFLKYYSNCFNAMKIIFANEFFEVCNHLGADYQKIKNAYILRGMAKNIYLDVNDNWRGYAGMCLPKDVNAMKSLVNTLELDVNLFKFLDEENQKFKPTVPEGMRL